MKDIITYLPSPASSTCDSLADIEDLDAFLQAQGQLARWPTPLKDETVVAEIELDDDDGCDEGEVLSDIAGIMAAATKSYNSISGTDVEIIRNILLRAQLPSEILAMAYNILLDMAMGVGDDATELLRSTSGELLVVSALTLAASYMNDNPPSFSCWSKKICDCRWQGTTIDQKALQIMATLNWRLYEFGTTYAVESALGVLERGTDSFTGANRCKLDRPEDVRDQAASLPLIVINGNFPRWVDGQITPGDTPSCLSTGSYEPRFLPLL